MGRSLVVFGVVVALCVLPRGASAEETPITQAEDTSADPQPESDVELPEERPVPDYDGRGPTPALGREKAAWIPRVILFPAFVATEFLLRRPLGWAVSKAEEREVPARVVEFFSLGEENQVLLAPTFSFDFGFRPNVGILFRYTDFLAEGNTLSASFSFGGFSWLSGSLANTYSPTNKNWYIAAKFNATRRPDGLFFGINDEVSDQNRARFNWVGYAAYGEFGFDEFWRQSAFSFSSGYRYRRFGDRVGSSISIPDRVDEGRIDELPPGFEDGYSVYFNSFRLTIDSRKDRPAPGSGFRITGGAELAFDLRDGPQEQLWLIYGGAVTWFADVSGYQHVISLRLSTSFADSLNGEVPFTELPRLGGNGPMRGFLDPFLIGESAIAATLTYDWPIWVWLDGTIHIAVGNTFDGTFEGLDFEQLRMSFGAGIAAVGSRQHKFEFLVGFGTDTFGDGPNVEFVRILFGATRDF